MPNRNRVAALVGMAGLAATAAGQDSVSSLGTGLPGDALNAFDTRFQRVDYVVDLATLTTSWGNEFGIAPIVKTSRVEPTSFFNNLFSGAGISQDLITDASFPADTYALWENAPGLGVHPDRNQTPGTIDAPQSGTLFGTLIQDFGTAETDQSNGVNTVATAVVGFDPAEPSRLYVSRVVSALSGPDADTELSTFGAGAVDASGNTYFRADSFGIEGGPGEITGNNIFRIRALDRDAGALNAITDAGGSDTGATDDLVRDADTHNAPGALPESIAGRPVYLGTNFNSQFVSETSPGNVTGTTDHITMAGGDSNDHRGNLAFSPITYPAFPGSVGTASLVGRRDVDNNDQNSRELLVFGVDGDGNLVDTAAVALPQVLGVSEISDPVDPFTIDFDFTNNVQNIGWIQNTGSQVPFRGPTGQSQVGVLPSGMGVAVGVTYNNVSEPIDEPQDSDPTNTVVAGVFDPSSPSDVEWSLVSWTGDPGDPFDGKPIKDGPGGNTIGNLTELFNVTGGTPAGPSVSNCFIDAKGNIWFLHAIVQEGEDDNGDPFIDFDSGLIRAVYDDATGGWELELILELGDVFAGPNSGVPYQITFLQLADSNSTGSGTLGSNAGNQAGWNNIDVSGLPQDDPRGLGGLVVNAEITYDVDADGDFNDPSADNPDDPNSLDESYQAQLLIANILPPDDACPPDLTGPGGDGVPDGSLTADDFFFYLGLFAAGDLDADLTGPGGDGVPDGSLTADDFFFYLGLFAAGCP